MQKINKPYETITYLKKLLLSSFIFLTAFASLLFFILSMCSFNFSLRASDLVVDGKYIRSLLISCHHFLCGLVPCMLSFRSQNFGDVGFFTRWHSNTVQCRRLLPYSKYCMLYCKFIFISSITLFTLNW